MARLIRREKLTKRSTSQAHQVSGRWVAGGVTVLLAGGIGLWAMRWSQRVEHPELPGVDVRGLNDQQVQTLLADSRQQPCTCGCGFTLADCRLKDPTCRHRRPILQRMVGEYRKRSRPEGL
jgi:hypothetical protein